MIDDEPQPARRRPGGGIISQDTPGWRIGSRGCELRRWTIHLEQHLPRAWRHCLRSVRLIRSLMLTGKRSAASLQQRPAQSTMPHSSTSMPPATSMANRHLATVTIRRPGDSVELRRASVRAGQPAQVEEDSLTRPGQEFGAGISFSSRCFLIQSRIHGADGQPISRWVLPKMTRSETRPSCNHLSPRPH